MNDREGLDMPAEFPANWSEVADFFQKREDRIREATRQAIDESIARAIAEFKTFSLEREQAISRRIEAQEHSMLKMEYKIDEAHRKADKLFSITDEMRPVPAKLDRLIEDMRAKNTSCEIHMKQMSDMERENLILKAKASGIKISWQFVVGLIGIAGLVITIVVNFSKLLGH